MTALPTVRARFRRIAFFCLGFFAIWTGLVAIVWVGDALPAGGRPAFRTAFWIAAAAFWLIWERQARPFEWLGITPLSPRVAALTAGAFFAVLACNVLRVQFVDAPHHGLVLGLGMAWGLASVVAEELVFRGVIQTALAERMPALAAVPLASVLFLAIHFPGWTLLGTWPDAVTIVSVFMIGLVCGILRHASGSLWPAIGAHWANNLGYQL